MSERKDDSGRDDGERDDSGRDDAPVPKLPRGKGLTLSWPQLTRIGLTLVTLVALVALQKPCSESVGRFVTTFGADPAEPNAQPATGTSASPGGGANPPAAPATAVTPAAPAPAAAPGDTAEPQPEYELMTTSMTDAELRAAFERAKRRAEAAKVKAAAESAPAPAPGSPPPPTSEAGEAASPAPQSPPKER